jgi:dolichyl-phosphate beta-glucosyltransferase
VARTLPTAGSPTAAAARQPQRQAWSRAVTVILACYLLAAVVVTSRLWADPASRTVAGNPNDADLFAWFMRYTATAVAHGRLPALVTTTMNAPRGISLMWNTSVLLPGILLTPVTLLAGPQTALTVLMTLGYAGSAASLMLVLRRWNVSTAAATLAGAVYGFSPALLQAATGHYNLQFAVLLPVIVHLGLRLCLRSASRRAALRDGVVLGLLVTAQLFTGEELLMLAGLISLLLVMVLAASRPREVAARLAPAATGLAVAAAVTILLTGYPLWVQFRGPLAQHGSAFTPDFFKNDLSGFITPSAYLLFHTASSAAAAASFQGGAPEYLGYLGWPLIIAAVVATIAFWQVLGVRATAAAAALLELLSLGGHPLISGTEHQGVTLPWHWLASVPLVGTVLPDRLSIVADGALAVLLAFSVDAARANLAPDANSQVGAYLAAPDSSASDSPASASPAPDSPAPDSSAPAADIPAAALGGATPAGGRLVPRRRRLAWLPMTVAVLACLPLLPLPLRPAQPPGLPAGWSAAFSRLRLAPDSRVLVVPVPTATQTDALRWQADTAEPGTVIGGYFVGPAWNGQAYVEGNGVAATATYLDSLWSGGPAPAPPSGAQVQSDLNTWRPAAVVAVTTPGSSLERYLQGLFGPPSFRSASVLVWRTH